MDTVTLFSLRKTLRHLREIKKLNKESTVQVCDATDAD
jgi:hypothetical protein